MTSNVVTPTTWLEVYEALFHDTSMNILAICHDVILCSAVLVQDGRVVSAIPEERLDRLKQSRAPSRRSLREQRLQRQAYRADTFLGGVHHQLPGQLRHRHRRGPLAACTTQRHAPRRGHNPQLLGSGL